MPYSLGNERLEKIPLGKIKGKLTEEEERKVATDMREVYDRLLPSDKVEEKRKKLVRKLEKIFNDEWPGHDIRAHLFGSSGNLLCSDDSDGSCRPPCPASILLLTLHSGHLHHHHMAGNGGRLYDCRPPCATYVIHVNTPLTMTNKTQVVWRRWYVFRPPKYPSSKYGIPSSAWPAT